MPYRLKIWFVAFAAIFPFSLKGQGQYGIISKDKKPIHWVATATLENGDLIIAGMEQSSKDAYIFRLNKSFEIQWTMKVPSQENNFILKNLKSFQNYILLAGVTLDYKNQILVKMDDKASIYWANNYKLNQGNTSSCIEFKNSFIHLISYTNRDYHYTRITETGSVEYTAARHINGERLVHDIAVSDEGLIYTCGYLTQETARRIGFIDLMDQSGNFLYSYTLEDIIPHDSYLYKIYPVGKEVRVVGHVNAGLPNHSIVLNLTLNQTELKGSLLSLQSDSLIVVSGLVLHDNEIFLSGFYPYISTSPRYAFQGKLGTGPNTKLEWAKIYGQNGFISGQEINSDANGNSIITGTMSQSLTYFSPSIFLSQTDKDGNSGCSQRNIKVAIKETPLLLTGEKISSYTISVSSNAVPFKLYYHDSFKVVSLCLFNAGFKLSDTIVCLGDSIHITDTSSSLGKFYWEYNGTSSTEANPDAFIPEDTGAFTVMQVVYNSAKSDTAFRRYQVNARPKAYAGADLRVCQGEQVTLTPSGGKNYKWSNMMTIDSTGYTDSINTFITEKSNYYYVEAFNQSSCSDIDSVYVEVIEPRAIPEGFDTFICHGNTINLSAGEEHSNLYLWSTGDTSANISVKEPGIYTVTASNECFSQTATFTVDTTDCRLYWYAPNAFTVNDDSHNDGFSIIGHNIEKVELRIYNRWGELVFAGTGKNPVWSGTFKDQAAPEGLYIYTVVITGIDKKKQFSKGNVMLLR